MPACIRNGRVHGYGQCDLRQCHLAHLPYYTHPLLCVVEIHTSTSVCSTILSAWLLVSLTTGTQICSQQHAAVPRTQTQGQQCPHVTACDCCWPQSCVALPISPYNLNRRRDVRFGLYFCCFIPESECLFVFHRGETIRAETSCVEIVNYRK